MNIELTKKENIRKYLLRNLPEDLQQEVEKRLFSEEDFLDMVTYEESDLIEDYLDNELTDAEKRDFEKKFAIFPQNQANIRLTKALRKTAKDQKSGTGTNALVKEPKEKFDFRKIFRILVPSFALLLLAFGTLYWWNYEKHSDLYRGIAALKDEFRTERPLKARLSDFDYSEFPVTRGAENKDSANLDRAKTYLLQAVKDSPKADSYHALGKYYLSAKDFEKSIKNLSKAIELDENNPKSNNDLGVAWLEKGKSDSFNDRGKGAIDFAQSLAYFDKALLLDNSLLEALFNRSEAYENLALSEKAIEDLENYLKKDSNSRWADEVRERLKILEEKKSQASISDDKIFERFQIAYENKNDEKAWDAIKQARSRSGNSIVQRIIESYLNDPPDSKNSLEMLRFAADVEKTFCGDFFTSHLADYYQNLSLTKKTAVIQAQQLMKEAHALYKNSKNMLASEKFTEAKKSFIEAGDFPESMMAESWRGYCFLRMPDFENALKTFEALETEYGKRHYESLQGQAFMGLADVLSSTGEPSKSNEFAEKALEVAEKIQDIELQIRSYQMRSVTDMDYGKYRESLDYTVRAFRLAQAFPVKTHVLWSIYSSSVDDLVNLKLLNAASAVQEKLTQLADRPATKSLSYGRLADFQSANGDFLSAIKSAEMALLPDEPNDDKKLREEINANISKTFGTIYLRNKDFAKALSYFQKSQNILEARDSKNENLFEIFGSKVLCYIGLNDNASAKQELQKAFEKLEIYRKNINEIEDRNQFFDDQQAYYDVAIDFANSQVRDHFLALNYAEKSRARSLLSSLQSNFEPAELKDLQNRLPEDAQILEFSVLESKVVSWVITKNSIQNAEVQIKSDELSKKVHDYLDLITSGNGSAKSELDEKANDLYSLLVLPNKPFLEANKKLFIVPDKDLNFLPFGSLRNAETGKYLIENFQLGSSPSLSVFVLSSENAKAKSTGKTERILSIGNPDFDHEKYPDLKDLPSAAREAEKVVSVYNSSSLLLNGNATEEKVRANLNDFEIIHFASHAVIDSQSSEESGLVLGTSTNDFDGTFRAKEIYEQKKFSKTKLVVLSACDTGIEQALRGEGAIGLAYPFLAQDVPLVIASLWEVDSDATSELMIKFHQNRKQKQLNSLEALREAQIEMIHSSNLSLSNPKAWSSFIAIGGETAY